MSPAIRQSWACSPCISKIPSSPGGHAWRQSPPKRKKRGRWLTPAYKNARKETCQRGNPSLFMGPDEAYAVALRRIREAENTGATSRSDLEFLRQLPRELEQLSS